MRRYRVWAGSPQGTLEDVTRCIALVADGGRSVLSHQCRKKRGHGPDGLYCAQHGKRKAAGRYVSEPIDRQTKGEDPHA